MSEKVTCDEAGMLRRRSQKEREAMSQRLRMFLEMANVISFLGGDITAMMKRLQVEDSKKGEGSPVKRARRKEARYWKFVETHQGQEAFVTWVTAETRDEAFLEFYRVSDSDDSHRMNFPGAVDQMVRESG